MLFVKAYLIIYKQAAPSYLSRYTIYGKLEIMLGSFYQEYSDRLYVPLGEGNFPKKKCHYFCHFRAVSFRF